MDTQVTAKQSPPVSELKKALFEAIERLPVMIEYEKVMAQVTRARYLALVNQGFTEKEALYLCRPADLPS